VVSAAVSADITQLFESVNISKNSLAHSSSSRPLELTVKSVLASGCEKFEALDGDPFGYFDNEEVRETVEDYLGPKNT